jgi:hypothetical protein
MLLDDIIAILSDEKGSLTSALLKTKVLLHTLGRKELAAWVTNELNGYPGGSTVPEYRILNAQVFGLIASITMRMTNFPLPLRHLTEKEQKTLTEQHCYMSISTIEKSLQSRDEKGTRLARVLPVENNQRFEEALEDGVHVLKAWCEINMMDAANVLSEVRSRLLDFCLELRDVVGIDVPEKDLVEKAAAVDTTKLFNTAINGDGNTIIIHPQGQVQTITNQKDDLEALIRTVAELGFEKPALDELKQAVLEDKGRGKVPDVTDGKTGKWFAKALKSAGKEVVKAGVDIVSSVIVKAMKAYAGQP